MKKVIKFFTFSLLLTIGLLGIATSPVVALDGGAETGFQKGVHEAGGDKSSSVSATVKNIINILLYAAGIIAVVVIVVAGIRFVTSEGDSQKTAKARDTIVNAAIGLVLAVLAYAAVNFILGQF